MMRFAPRGSRTLFEVPIKTYPALSRPVTATVWLHFTKLLHASHSINANDYRMGTFLALFAKCALIKPVTYELLDGDIVIRCLPSALFISSIELVDRDLSPAINEKQKQAINLKERLLQNVLWQCHLTNSISHLTCGRLQSVAIEPKQCPFTYLKSVWKLRQRCSNAHPNESI